MHIFIIITVFNRLDYTKAVLRALKLQTLRNHLKIIVVDDGSTDGTGEFLESQEDVTTIKGSGNLWWAGATQIGLKYARQFWRNGDYVLFLNNDLMFDETYIESILTEAKLHPNSAIGSALYELGSSESLMRLGAKIDFQKHQIYDLVSSLSPEELQNPKEIYEVDALSGRGVLYQVEFFEKFGFLRPRLLPHYFADYEISMRFRKSGVALLVSTNARVFSLPIFGYQSARLSFRETFFSNRSQKNIFHSMVFYILVSPGLGSIVMPALSLYWGLKDMCLHLLKDRKDAI